MSDLSRFAHPDFWLPNNKPACLLRPRQGHPLATGLIRAWVPNQASDRELIAGAGITPAANFGGVQALNGVPAFSPGSTISVSTNGFDTDQNIPYGANGTIIVRACSNIAVSGSASPYVFDATTSSNRTLVYRPPGATNDWGWYLGGALIVDAGSGAITDLFDHGVPTTCAFTWTSGNVQNIYKNGALAGASPYAKTASPTAQAVRLGDRYAGVGGFTTGLGGPIEYILFYDRALSPNEIQAQFHDPFSMFEPAEEWPEPGWSVAAGGTTYNQSVLASTTPASALVRQTGKPQAITNSAVAALARAIGKPVLATNTPASQVVRQTGKPQQASNTSTASLSQIKVVLASILASNTPAARLVRQTGKNVLASDAATAALARSVGKPQSASNAALATVTKQTAKSLLQSNAALASLTQIRVFLSTLLASTTPVSRLVRAIGRPLLASNAAAAAVTKAISRSLSASNAVVAGLTKQTAKALRAINSALADLLATLLSGGVKVCTATASEALLVNATASDARIIAATASEAIS